MYHIHCIHCAIDLSEKIRESIDLGAKEAYNTLRMQCPGCKAMGTIEISIGIKKGQRTCAVYYSSTHLSLVEPDAASPSGYRSRPPML